MLCSACMLCCSSSSSSRHIAQEVPESVCFPPSLDASPVQRACLSTPALCARQINPNVSSLALYDVVGTPGVAADISHINSKAQVKVRHGGRQPPVHKGIAYNITAWRGQRQSRSPSEALISVLQKRLS